MWVQWDVSPGLVSAINSLVKIDSHKKKIKLAGHVHKRFFSNLAHIEWSFKIGTNNSIQVFSRVSWLFRFFSYHLFQIERKNNSNCLIIVIDSVNGFNNSRVTCCDVRQWNNIFKLFDMMVEEVNISCDDLEWLYFNWRSSQYNVKLLVLKN